MDRLMKHLLSAAAVAALLISPAAGFAKPGNNGNGNGNGNAPAHAAKKGNNGNGNGRALGQQKNHGNGSGNGNSRAAQAAAGTSEDVTDEEGEVVANPGNVFNCPPGLAHRNPPCVPPGQAKKGVTFRDWTGYSDEDIEGLIDEAARPLEDVEPDVEEERYLTEDEIIDLFDLDPPEEGMHYAVIDGEVVELNDRNYDLLQRVRTIASVPDVGNDLEIEPTVSLTQRELRAIYDLPRPGNDNVYSVVDGSLLSLDRDTYDLLQLVRLYSGV